MSSEELSAKIYALGEVLMKDCDFISKHFRPEKEGPYMDILATIRPGEECTEVQLGGLTLIVN